MHRSGTSLIAKVLHEAGIHMGAERDHNEESIPFLSINQQLMDAKGNSWIDPTKFDAEYHSPESAISMFVNHFKIDPTAYTIGGKPNARLLKWQNNRPWGFKDPRNTFTLQAWLELFPKSKVIHVVRHPAAVADSLQRRNQVEGEVFDERLNNHQFNIELWKTYVSTAEKQLSELPSQRKLTVKYEDLLAGGRTLTNLGRFVGVDLVREFSELIYPDRAKELPKLNLTSVSDLMQKFGYEA